MNAFVLHGGDVTLGGWAMLFLFWIVLPLILLVFLSIMLGKFLRKREEKRKVRELIRKMR